MHARTWAVRSLHRRSLTPPIITYTHGLGCSITGGYVYRGVAVPALTGKYLYSDYCSGRLWTAQRNGAGTWSATELGATGLAVSSFGEDEAGELYFTNYATGDIYRFADSNPSTVVDVIEYYHAGFDHYFITSHPDEIAALDAGQFSGWERSQQSFRAWSGRKPGRPRVPVLHPPGDRRFTLLFGQSRRVRHRAGLVSLLRAGVARGNV